MNDLYTHPTPYIPPPDSKPIIYLCIFLSFYLFDTLLLAPSRFHFFFLKSRTH